MTPKLPFTQEWGESYPERDEFDSVHGSDPDEEWMHRERYLDRLSDYTPASVLEQQDEDESAPPSAPRREAA